MSITLNVYATKVGDRFRSRNTGQAYEVTYVAPAGSMGRSMSEGPVPELKPVYEEGRLGHPTIVVGHRCLRQPKEFTLITNEEAP